MFISSCMDLVNVHVSELYRKIGSMYVSISFSFKLVVNLSFSNKWRRLLAAFIARIFLFLISSSVSRSVPRSLHFFPLMILSADNVIFRFVFVHFQFYFTKIFFCIMFISADIVVVTGKLAKIIGILHSILKCWICVGCA